MAALERRVKAAENGENHAIVPYHSVVTFAKVGFSKIGSDLIPHFCYSRFDVMDEPGKQKICY